MVKYVWFRCKMMVTEQGMASFISLLCTTPLTEGDWALQDSFLDLHDAANQG